MLTLILLLLLPSCAVSDQGLQEEKAQKFPPFNADEIRAITHGEPWPLPQKIQYLHVNRALAGRVRIVFEGVDASECDILEHLKSSHERRLSQQWTQLADTKASDRDPFFLIVRVSKCPNKDEYPQQGMDEEYHLYVPASGNATLEAREVWGALRGTETFSQLFYAANGTVHVRAATVHDWPEYPFRGTLIDTSRHFLPKYVVLRHI
ncbi:beta-hexosaminidase subunit beta, partial [Aphelenchoides avenae]